MITDLRRHWGQHLKCLLCSFALVSSASLEAAGQQTDQLQQQLQQLQQQYETTTHDLEQRITALQQEIDKEKEAREQQNVKVDQATESAKQATVSAAELAARDTRKVLLGESDQAGGKFQGDVASEPSYDMLKEADEKIEKLKEQEGAFRVSRILPLRIWSQQRRRATGGIRSAWGRGEIPLGERSRDLRGVDLCQQLDKPGPRLR